MAITAEISKPVASKRASGREPLKGTGVQLFQAEAGRRTIYLVDDLASELDAGGCGYVAARRLKMPGLYSQHR